MVSIPQGGGTAGYGKCTAVSWYQCKLSVLYAESGSLHSSVGTVTMLRDVCPRSRSSILNRSKISISSSSECPPSFLFNKYWD